MQKLKTIEFISKNKIYIKSLLLAMFSEISFMFFLNKRYDFIITCFLFVFLFFYLKTDKEYSKKTCKYSMILSLILAIIISLGAIYSLYVWHKPFTVLNTVSLIKIILIFLGMFLFFNRILKVFFDNCDKVVLFENQNKMKKRYFLILWGLIFLCWIPYFISFFPAAMSPDSYYVIHYANEGILSDLHTFGHTWFFGIFFHLGKVFTSNLNIAVAFGTVAQMLILSFIFALTIKFLYEKGLKKIICFLLFLVYAFSPLNAKFSVTLWRDVLFGASFVPICMYLFDYVNNNYKLNKFQIIGIVLCLLMLLFFRNNGIYVLIALIVMVTIFSKKHKILIPSIGTIIIILYFVIKGPVFNYFGIASTKSIEAYSIPLQQIARVIYSEGNINADELEYLESIMEIDKVADNYNQVLADPIKNISNGELISSNLSQFISVWFKLLLKNPITYVEAYIFQTIGYWYPNIEYNYTPSVGKSFFEENVYNVFVSDNIFNKIIDTTSSLTFPFSSFFWSIGLYLIILLVCTFITLYLNKKQYILMFLPIWSLWLTIMISTPVFSETRYMYGLFISIPLLLCLTFYKNNNNL